MELIIGRDGATAKLKVVNGTQVTLYGEAASVPGDVSRQHCQLTAIDDNTFVIKNIKSANVTWVNGIEIQSKHITKEDKVQLGKSRFDLPLEEILEQMKPNIVDIEGLKPVWDEYNKSMIAIRKRQQTNSLLARIPIFLTMLGGLLIALSESIRPYSITFTVIALLIMAYGFYRQATDRSIDKQEKLKKQFQRDYVCPKCGRFMGFIDYDLLHQNNNCPGCKARFKK
jgi:hypothetical protein